MSVKNIQDLIIEDKEIYNDWVLGGDSSTQLSGDITYLIYATVAFHKSDLNLLADTLQSVIKKFAKWEGDCELHAKDIWNGSSRKKTSFRTLENKESVKAFFVEVCKAIAKFKPIIVANCWVQSSEDVKDGRAKDDKALLAYNTLSRLNLNIEMISGKPIGTSLFYTDKECERMMKISEKDKNKLEGMLSEARPVINADSTFNFVYKINPTYIPVNSSDSLLVQIADLAAYFVGKHLKLTEEIDREIEMKSILSADLYKKMEDCNFALFLWQLMDIEVVGFYNKQYPLPTWLTRALKVYKKSLMDSVDAANISIRESIIASKKDKEWLNGTGYYTFIMPNESDKENHGD